MDDFDILYMIKTPLFMGKAGSVMQEANQVEIHSEDAANQLQKNLLMIRAMTAAVDFNALKAFMQQLASGENKDQVQGFSVLVQYMAQKVSKHVS